MIIRAARDFALLFVFTFLGQWVAPHLPFTLPGSIVGMLFLFLALVLGIVKLDWIEQGSGLLIKYMAVMFVPLGVGLVAYLAVIRHGAFPFILSTLVSTFITMAVAGLIFERTRS